MKTLLLLSVCGGNGLVVVEFYCTLNIQYMMYFMALFDAVFRCSAVDRYSVVCCLWIRLVRVTISVGPLSHVILSEQFEFSFYGHKFVFVFLRGGKITEKHK